MISKNHQFQLIKKDINIRNMYNSDQTNDEVSIHFLISLIEEEEEKIKNEDREMLKTMQESWNRTLKHLNIEPIDFEKYNEK